MLPQGTGLNLITFNPLLSLSEVYKQAGKTEYPTFNPLLSLSGFAGFEPVALYFHFQSSSEFKARFNFMRAEINVFNFQSSSEFKYKFILHINC